MKLTRWLLTAEVMAFGVASLIHAGRVLEGYAHREASIAEGVITAALLGGLAVTLLWPASTRLAGLVSQGFALMGTLVGLFTIVVGVGPRTLPDVVFHAGLVVLLTWGLIRVGRRTSGRANRADELL